MFDSKLSRRDLLKMMGLASAGAFLAACGTPEPTAEPTEEMTGDEEPMDEAPELQDVEVIMMYQVGEVGEDNIEAFNQEYAPVTLTVIEFNDTQYWAMYAAGTPPDILRTQAPSLPQRMARGTLLNLQPYFDASDVIVEDDLTLANDYYRFTNPLNQGSGDLYGMTKDWAPDAFIWVNELVWESAGKTPPSPDDFPMDIYDFKAMCEDIKQTEGDAITVQAYTHMEGFMDRIWMRWLAGVDESMYADSFATANFVNNELANEAIRYHYDMYTEKLTTSLINPGVAWFGPDFVNGQQAMVETGYWFRGWLAGQEENEVFAEARDAGKVKMYPAATFHDVRYDPTVTATGGIVSEATSHPDEVWAVFEWFFGKEPAEQRAESGWGLPAMQSMWDMIPQEGAFDEQLFATVNDELQYIEPVIKFNPFLPGGEPNVPAAAFVQNIEEAAAGGLSYDEFVARVEEVTQTAIQEGIDRLS